MIPALTVPARTETLEQARAALQQQDATLTEARKAFALDLHRLRLRWAMLYPRSSTREFIAWFSGGEVSGRYYAGLNLPSKTAKHAKIEVSQRVFRPLRRGAE